MKGFLLLYNLKLNSLIFSTGLNGSLIIFIRTYTVNYRNALDRLRVRMNIILFPDIFNQGFVRLPVVKSRMKARTRFSARRKFFSCAFVLFSQI